MVFKFSPAQERLIRAAISGIAFSIVIGLALGVLLVLLKFFQVFSGVFMPFATAGILSLLLRPVYLWILERTRMPPVAALVLIFLGLLLPMLFMLYFFGGMLLSQTAQLISGMPETAQNIRELIVKHSPAVENMIEQAGGWESVSGWIKPEPILAALGGGINGILSALGGIGSLFSWMVLPVYMVFMIMAPPFHLQQLREFLPFLKNDQRDDFLYLLKEFVDIVVVFFRGQLIIAAAQGILMAVGFSIVGLKYGFVLGLTLGLLNLVPYLGNIVGLSVTLPLAYLQPDGGLGMLIGVLIVILITQGVEAYILTPRIMGESTGLHPMAVIFAMFFWGKALGGIFGLVLAIPLTAFAVILWHLLRDKYLPALEPDEKEAAILGDA